MTEGARVGRREGVGTTEGAGAMEVWGRDRGRVRLVRLARGFAPPT